MVDGEIVDQERPLRARVVAGEVIEAVSFRSAPYPTPDDLAKYEEIHPGFTDRILRLTEQETAHRIERENKQDDATIKLATRGQLLAFVVVMTLVCGGIAAILAGHSVVGFAGLIVAAATLAGSFIAPRIFGPKQLEPPPPGTAIEPAPEHGREQNRDRDRDQQT
ncbi:MAG: DUF2335 domain-containing protein [Solirubrobacteraceae bacterium]